MLTEIQLQRKTERKVAKRRILADSRRRRPQTDRGYLASRVALPTPRIMAEHVAPPPSMLKQLLSRLPFMGR